MAKSTAFSNSILKLIFNGTPIAALADNAAASSLTFLYVALHTADPGVGGTQTTSEIAYTGYARVAVKRDGTGWTVVGASVSPVDNIDFPTGTGGAGVASFFSVGTAANGAGTILYSGAINPTITTGNGITPRLAPSSTVTES